MVDRHLRHIIENLPKKTGFVIDIGASTGVETDPVYPYISSDKYRGLCIEGDMAKLPELRKNTSSTFSICPQFITPNNVLSVFEYFEVPTMFDLLKIDIDGYDLEVLRTILTTYRPRVIIAEINEKIPPPIHFEIPYREKYEWDYSHCFGFSLAAGDAVMRKHGYVIESLYCINNILCIDAGVCDLLHLHPQHTISELYDKDYVNHNDRFACFHVNQDVYYWHDIKNDPTRLLHEIITYFETRNDRSQWEKKTKKEGVDFIAKIA